MRELRQLSSEADFMAFIKIAARAYPGIKIAGEEDRRRRVERMLGSLGEPDIGYYGLFDQLLLGGMCLHDYVMNVFGTKLKAGGVGFVAVDMLHKKEHVAKELISFFLRRCREQAQPLALLYPFRPDFYKQMGFGYGTKMNQYRVHPASLPRGPSRANIHYLEAGDAAQLAACYSRFCAARHGLIERRLEDAQSALADEKSTLIGYKKDDLISGYLRFSFKPLSPENVLRNTILVHELVYEHPDALAELMTFLHTQADQIDQIIFETQDSSFHHLLFDPRNSSLPMIASLYQESNLQGLGIMYRVVDMRRLLEGLADHNFGGVSCSLKLSLRDSFLPDNAGDLLIRFDQGRARLQAGGAPDASIGLDVAELSSLLMGVVSFRSLYRYGLATLSEPGLLDTVNQLFLAEEPPMCMTLF